MVDYQRLAFVNNLHKGVEPARQRGAAKRYNGRNDDVLLFVAKQSAVSAVRIEAEYRYARLIHDEILLEGFVEQSELAEKRRVGMPELGREGSEFPSETHVP